MSRSKSAAAAAFSALPAASTTPWREQRGIGIIGDIIGDIIGGVIGHTLQSANSARTRRLRLLAQRRHRQ
jgi:hypothetical protein